MESEVTFQLFADKVCLLLAKVCRGTQILHNFEKFVDLPQNRKFLTLFRFDAHVFPFTKECYVLFLLGRTERNAERKQLLRETRQFPSQHVSCVWLLVEAERGVEYLDLS